MMATIILISPIHWYSTWQSPQAMASAFRDRGYQVIFVEPLPKRWPKLSELVRVFGRLFGRSHIAGHGTQKKPGENITLISPLVIPETNRIFRKLNALIFQNRLVAKIQDYVQLKPVFVLNYLPISISIHLMNELNPDIKGYVCASDWEHHPFVDQKNVFEDEMLATADIVWGDAPYLLEKLSARHNNVYQKLPAISQEMLEKFASSSITSKNEKVQDPLCVYFGTVGMAIDNNLIYQVSHRYRTRIIGPVRISQEGFSENTEFLSPQNHDRLPDLLRDADVLLLPYDKNAGYVSGIIPAKTIECLATGKPGIIYGLSSLDEFKELFYICNTHEEFLEAILSAISENPELRHARIDKARQHTWEKRVEDMETQILQVLRKKEIKKS